MLATEEVEMGKSPENPFSIYVDGEWLVVIYHLSNITKEDHTAMNATIKSNLRRYLIVDFTAVSTFNTQFSELLRATQLILSNSEWALLITNKSTSLVMIFGSTIRKLAELTNKFQIVDDRKLAIKEIVEVRGLLSQDEAERLLRG